MRRETRSRMVRWLIVAAMCALPVQGFAQQGNVVVVATDGTGDFTDPVAALNSIVDASADKPYLLKINPGVYTLDSSSRLYLKSYVDIEGSGEGVTKIQGTTTPTYGGWYYDGVVVGNNTSNTEIRNITIEALPSPQGNSAVISNNSGSFRASNVTLTASLGGRYNSIYVSQGVGESIHFTHATMNVSTNSPTTGSAYAFDGAVGNPGTGNKVIIDDSAISVSGQNAVAVRGGSAASSYEINNTTITANGYASAAAVWTTAASLITIKKSTIVTSCSLYPSYIAYYTSSASVKLADTQVTATYVLWGDASKGKCIGLYNANLTPVTCP